MSKYEQVEWLRLVNTNPKIYSQLSCTKFDVSNCMLCLRDKR